MKFTSNLDNDDIATIYSTRGWIEELESKPQLARFDYQYALELWEKEHGNKYASVGWGHMLLGKTYAEVGNLTEAAAHMRSGLSILSQTSGIRSARYLTAEIAYSHLLDQTGLHDEAAKLRDTAEQGIREVYRAQCAGCAISAESFR